MSPEMTVLESETPSSPAEALELTAEAVHTDLEAQPLSSAPRPNLLEQLGLPMWAKITIVFLSIVLATASIFYAWGSIGTTQSTMQLQAETIRTLGTVAQEVTKAPDLEMQAFNTTSLLTHLADNQAQLQHITNHQSLALLGIGLAISLLAIGFALFLLGADGAFRLHAAGRNDNSLMFQSTAPGLLCFLLAAILIGMSMTRSSQLDTGGAVLIHSRGYEQMDTSPPDDSKMTQPANTSAEESQ